MRLKNQDFHRCPGQDQRYWKPEDIFEMPCPHCGIIMEFWKDEPLLNCHQCHRSVRNPKIDTGCAEWCKQADKCLGTEEDRQKNGQ